MPTNTATVYVAVNRNTIDDGRPARLDVEAHNADASAYLDLEQAEELAVAILDAAGLTTRTAGYTAVAPIPTLAASYRHPGDEGLRQLEADTRRLLDSTLVVEADLVGRIANALTGELNGYRSRALKRAILDALEQVRDADEADLKAAEAARWEARR